jgi:hypothetical protein
MLPRRARMFEASDALIHQVLLFRITVKIGE